MQMIIRTLLWYIARPCLKSKQKVWEAEELRRKEENQTKKEKSKA